jgi:hypothetical protein
MNFDTLIPLSIGIVLGSSVTVILKNREISRLEFLIDMLTAVVSSDKSLKGYSIKFINIDKNSNDEYTSDMNSDNDE